MSAPTITFNEKNERIITLSRNGKRVTHVFPDHWLELREVAENGRGPLYYIIAHNYGTGEETLLFLEDQNEYEIVEREMVRSHEIAEFKETVKAYKTRNVGKDFVEAVEAMRCIKFCDEWLKEAEASATAKHLPMEVGFFGVEPRISDEDLKELCSKPLEAKTDPLKLKELEQRFPGATMVLSTTKKVIVVKYLYEDLYVDEDVNHNIISDVPGSLPFSNFASIGPSPRQNGKPQLMAEWREMYIDLSHLF
jgi:hypothetical protein